MTSTDLNRELPDQTTIVIGLAIQALIKKLLASGTLDPEDLADMRAYGLQFAANLATYRLAEVPGGAAALENRIVSWWERLNAPALYANDP